MKTVRCPNCNSKIVYTIGKSGNMEVYKCMDCLYTFNDFPKSSNEHD